jgi:nitroreductase
MPDLTLDALEQFLARQRAIRRFTTREVDDALVERVLAAATRAPSARNVQPWRFVVVREREAKARLGAIFDELGAALSGGPPDRTPWAEVPVLIAVCSEYAFGRTEAGAAALGASIYPAVQNMLLAAHAFGLGAVLTTRWKAREAEVRDILGVPDAMAVHVIVPMGWPDRRYGRGRRLPLRELTFRERYGDKW